MTKDITLIPAKDTIFLKKIKSKSEISKLDKQDGYLIDADEKEARKIIDFLRAKSRENDLLRNRRCLMIAVLGRDDLFNRRVIETMKIHYLVSPEAGWRKDTLKQRDSGLNHVVAKIAREKAIAVVIDLSALNKLKAKDKALRLARIMQNVKICRRAKCKIKIATFAEKKQELISERDIQAFAFSLGMSSEQVKDAMKF